MTHEEIRNNLNAAQCAACDRIETLEACLVDRDTANATLTAQVDTLTQERDARPTVEQWRAIQDDLAFAQTVPNELRAEVERLQAEISRLNAAIDAAQSGNNPPA